MPNSGNANQTLKTLVSLMVLAACLVGLVAPATAGMIHVLTTDTTITITGPKNQVVKVFKNGASVGVGSPNTGSTGTVTVHGSSGDFSGDDVSVTVGTEDYAKHVVIKENKTTTSWITAAQAKSENDGKIKSNFDTNPFDDDSSIFRNDGSFNGQFMLINTSTNTAFTLEDVAIYTGADNKFFNQPTFDSAAAIASGNLFYDENAAHDLLKIGADNGTFLNQYLSLAIGRVDVRSYSLLIGEALPILANGSLGPPVDFSVAIRAVPEPSAIALLFSGLLGAWFVARRRRAV